MLLLKKTDVEESWESSPEHKLPVDTVDAIQGTGARVRDPAEVLGVVRAQGDLGGTLSNALQDGEARAHFQRSCKGYWKQDKEDLPHKGQWFGGRFEFRIEVWGFL